MTRRRTTYIIILLVVILTVVFGVGRWIAFSSKSWATYKNNLLSGTHGDYLNARKLWDAHPVTHYRLTIERVAPYYNDADAPRCQQDLEIEDEKVIMTFEDTCTSFEAFRPMAREWIVPDPPFETTVTQFFAIIDRDTRHIYWTAQGVGCSIVWLEAEYDSQGGYPTRLFYNLEMPFVGRIPIPSEDLDSDDLASGKPGPSCLTIGVVPGPTIAISLTPLP